MFTPYFKSGLALLAIVLGGTGCMVGPHYNRPADPAVTQFASADSTYTLTQEPAVEWWKTFNDPMLDGLIVQAVDGNRNLAAAAARVREARALRSESAAALYPKLDFNAGYTRTRASENLIGSRSGSGGSSAGGGADSGSGSGSSGGSKGGSDNGNSGNGSNSGGDSGAGAGASSSAASGGSGATPEPNLYSNLYNLGFDASWELDLWGRVRRQVQAADAEVQAAVENERAVLVSLLGELARNYVELRGNQLQLTIANQNIQSQNETVTITLLRYNAGLTSELDVANARAQLAATRSSLPNLQTSMHQSAHRIAVLTGTVPQALLDDLLTTAPIPAPVPEVPVGLPSELLRRRPDIRASERELAASNARIGAAIGELFPRVTLNGSAGLTAGKADDALDWDSRTWSFGPSVRVPIFQGGALRAAVEAANARQQQALAAYEQTVFTALEEAENAIVAYRNERERNMQLRQAVEATQRGFDLSHQLYTRGLTDFLNVLQTQRNLFLSQDELAESNALLSTDIIAIYKALGGGWENTLPEMATTVSAPPAMQVSSTE